MFPHARFPIICQSCGQKKCFAITKSDTLFLFVIDYNRPVQVSGVCFGSSLYHFQKQILGTDRDQVYDRYVIYGRDFSQAG